MSTWTNERHDQVRRRLNATDGALHLGWDDGLDEPMQEVVANAYDDIADALDEIERLRAESARRMVWLETEQRAHEQTHAALVDMTEKAAKPEVTDDMVERAAREMAGLEPGEPWPSNIELGGSPTGTRDDEHRTAWREEARAALEAALNTKENES